MSSLSFIINKQTAAIVLLLVIGCSLLEAKLLRRSRLYDDPSMGAYDGPYASGATGERALITVRGARNPYDGSAPNKIAIEDNPYRGPYPRGIYDRLDAGYGRGLGGPRMPLYPQNDYGYNSGYNSNYGGGYNSGTTKRRDFLDPDFGVKASLNLASKRQRSNCRLNTEADSEIPELGLDSGHLNIDCDVNPARIADAAVRVARTYGKYRNQRRQPPHKSSSTMRRKRTRINIDSEYERSRDNGDDDDESAQHNQSPPRHQHRPSSYSQSEGDGDDDED